MKCNRMILWVLVVGVGMVGCTGSEEPKERNPLLESWETPLHVPPFDEIKLEHYGPAFDAAMVQQNEAIEAIVADEEEPTFENTMVPFVFSGEALERVVNVFFNIEAAETSEEMQRLAQEYSPKLTGHVDAIYMNRALYERIAAIPKEGLDEQQARLLSETILDFQEAGVDVPEEKQGRLREINERLSVLTLQFGNNTLAETNNFKIIISDEEQLAGLPEGVKAAAAEAAKKEGEEGKWIFTPHKPSMLPFLTYAENDSLRQALYELYYKRGDRGNEHDNKATLTEIVNLRLERAKILGSASHAEYVLKRNMAKTPAAVLDFLHKLWTPALANAKAERAELEKIKHAEGKMGPLHMADWWYYAEKVRKEKYSLDEESLRPYFSLENAREAIFTLAGKLYGLQFKRRDDLPIYHPEVEAYEVLEEDGRHLSVIYFDFFPRPGKSSGAWCTGYVDAHRNREGEWVAPVVSIVTNFTRPSGNEPALLTFEEVTTLFHEFGHALHGFFSIKEYPGMGSTPRDFVELPSQVLEHWAGAPEYLKMYAKHYKTGEPIPDSLVEKITQSALFNQGFATLENLAASLLDMSYHARTEPLTSDASSYEREEMDNLGLIPEILPRYRSTYFGHIFSGGYSSGYYSYLWAEAMDCDVWQAFVESGDIFNRALAQQFREKVLQWGNARDAAAMFRDFRGRDVAIEGLFKNRGLQMPDEAESDDTAK